MKYSIFNVYRLIASFYGLKTSLSLYNVFLWERRRKREQLRSVEFAFSTSRHKYLVTQSNEALQIRSSVQYSLQYINLRLIHGQLHIRFHQLKLWRSTWTFTSMGTQKHANLCCQIGWIETDRWLVSIRTIHDWGFVIYPYCFVSVMRLSVVFSWFEDAFCLFFFVQPLLVSFPDQVLLFYGHFMDGGIMFVRVH